MTRCFMKGQRLFGGGLSLCLSFVPFSSIPAMGQEGWVLEKRLLNPLDLLSWTDLEGPLCVVKCMSSKIPY